MESFRWGLFDLWLVYFVDMECFRWGGLFDGNTTFPVISPHSHESTTGVAAVGESAHVVSRPDSTVGRYQSLQNHHSPSLCLRISYFCVHCMLDSTRFVNWLCLDFIVDSHFDRAVGLYWSKQELKMRYWDLTVKSFIFMRSNFHGLP
jgi:hypothetical protein